MIHTEGPVFIPSNHQRARPAKTVQTTTHDNTTRRLRKGRTVSAGMLCIMLAKSNSPFISQTARCFNLHPAAELTGVHTERPYYSDELARARDEAGRNEVELNPP